MNHYAVLGVSEDATIGQIKLAYRKLAAQHHPDRGDGDEEAMAAVNEAYNCLKDPERRAWYDEHGMAPKQHPDQGARNVLMQAIVEALNSPTGNPLTNTRMAINHALGNIGNNLLDLPHQVKLAEKRSKLVRKKIEGDNIFAGVIDQRIDNLKKQIEQMEQMRKDATRALELLNEYEELPDEERELRTLGAWAYTTTSTTF